MSLSWALGGAVALAAASVPLFFKPVWFGLGLIWLIFTLWAVLPVVHLLARLVAPGAEYCWSERLCNVLFRMLFGSCWWLHVDGPTSEDWARVIPDEALQRGCVFMVNHTSFVDGFMFSGLTPQRVIARARTLMKGGIFKTPVIGSVFSRLGHLPVHFTREADNSSFSVDKEAQSLVTAEVQRHLASGGVLAFCPEGSINRGDQTTLLPFRRGTFQIVLDHKVPVFGLTVYGNHHFWPTKKQMGGYPASIYANVFAVEEWNAQLGSSTLDAAALCELCEKRMQVSLAGCAARARAAGEKTKSK
ncbi:hypothetical protein T492DRAFT_1003865 [Pavlovales sp. CCMP2436]|nr:hypothetical protein T492DRAFT_1003865 [Pavlovales sp. CCMP2436]|mmetsp:Transcript_2071/g.5564  ORF Transcript_2071/g.5564 Transcript_2071/m.5564 type:complete len:303 (-) Transcript_2071:217-1125(-)